MPSPPRAARGLLRLRAVVAASLLLGCIGCLGGVGSPAGSPTPDDPPAPLASSTSTSSELPLRPLPRDHAAAPTPDGMTAPSSRITAPIPALTIVFDTSASRAFGFAGKVARLGELVAALRERQGDFPLRVAAFDQEVEVVFVGPASGFGEHELQRLWSRRPLGASDLGAALQWAVGVTGEGRVLIATDGMPTAGRLEAAELARMVDAAGFRIDAIVDHSPLDQPELDAITAAPIDDGVVADGRLPADRLADGLLTAMLLPVQVEGEGSTWSWPPQHEAGRTDDDPHARRRLAVTTALEASRLAPALLLALEWAEQAPDDVVALLTLGEALEHNGMPRSAARAYGSLVELHPEAVAMRLHAGTRLEPLGDDALALAMDGYRHAIRLGSGRSPEPMPHRRLAYAQLRAGQPEAAWDTLAACLREHERYHGSDEDDAVASLLREDLGIAAAAWRRVEPKLEGVILARVASLGTSIATRGSIRFEASAETDDPVSLHVSEGVGRRTDSDASVLRWGGQPCPERLQSHGIACFVVLQPPLSLPYRLRVGHVLRSAAGASDHGLATLQIVEHDGRGGLRFDHRPLLLMKAQASVELDVPSRSFGPPSY